jgi:hypothetical protein
MPNNQQGGTPNKDNQRPDPGQQQGGQGQNPGQRQGGNPGQQPGQGDQQRQGQFDKQDNEKDRNDQRR